MVDYKKLAELLITEMYPSWIKATADYLEEQVDYLVHTEIYSEETDYFLENLEELVDELPGLKQIKWKQNQKLKLSSSTSPYRSSV